MLTHRIGRIAQFLLIPLLIGSAGCQNHNLFSKLHGDSSDPATLTSEAAIALRNKNFSQALDLANRVLGDDPNNSDALYDRAAARMGLAGLNLSVMVSNVLGQVGASSVSSSVLDFSDLIRRGRDGASAQNSCGGVNSLIGGLDCGQLNATLTSVLDDLNKILDGLTHGTIQSSDSALLFDLGVLNALNAATVAASHQYIDVVNTNGTFGIVAGSQLNSLCTNSTDALGIVRDIAFSYRDFNLLIQTAQLKDNSLTQNIRDQVNVAGQKILAKGSGQVLPQACFDNIYDAHTPNPVTAGNYLNGGY